jgi:putative restriction endonuclease
MMIAIAPTDIDWFQFLKQRLNFSAINFWTDRPWNPRRINEGDKFYFLLKAPIRKIGGYANFVYYENLTIEEAWQKFGRGNGVNSLYELGVKATGELEPDFTTEIGCLVLENPVFLEIEDYFHPTEYNLSFSNQISKLKYYSQLNQINFASDYKQVGFSFASFNSKENYEFKESSRVKGQSKFRQSLTKFYNQQGAISGETCLTILDAVHINPHINENKNHIKNGVLLRSDLHKLFDEGLLTITPDYKVVIADELATSDYYKYNHQQINLPEATTLYPSQQLLKFHNQYIFRDRI